MQWFRRFSLFFLYRWNRLFFFGLYVWWFSIVVTPFLFFCISFCFSSLSFSLQYSLQLIAFRLFAALKENESEDHNFIPSLWLKIFSFEYSGWLDFQIVSKGLLLNYCLFCFLFFYPHLVIQDIVGNVCSIRHVGDSHDILTMEMVLLSDI